MMQTDGVDVGTQVQGKRGSTFTTFPEASCVLDGLSCLTPSTKFHSRGPVRAGVQLNPVYLTIQALAALCRAGAKANHGRDIAGFPGIIPDTPHRGPQTISKLWYFISVGPALASKSTLVLLLSVPVLPSELPQHWMAARA